MYVTLVAMVQQQSPVVTPVIRLQYAARVSLLDTAISQNCHNYCLLSIYRVHNRAPHRPRQLEPVIYHGTAAL